MDAVLLRMLEQGLGSKGACNVGKKAENSSSSDEEDGVVFERKAGEKLYVEQVKVVDIEGGLKVLYPSRTDLAFDHVAIKWD